VTLSATQQSLSPHDMPTAGFEGAVSGMTLADLLQIKNISRFSGCLSVEHRGKRGLIYFRDGEPIHAEQDRLTGTAAFFQIAAWPGGEFKAVPKVATTCHTISNSLTFLLLESLRLKDEQSQGQTGNQPPHHDTQPAASGHTGGTTMSSDINGKLQSIPDVTYAVVLTRDGTPVDDSSYEGATYAANGIYLSMFASRLGSQLGVGEFVSAAVQGCDNHLLLFRSKQHYLSISVNGSSQLGAVEAAVRKSMTQK